MKQFDYNKYKKNNPLLKEDVPTSVKLLRDIPEEILKDFYSRVKKMESEGTDLDSCINYAIYDIQNGEM